MRKQGPAGQTLHDRVIVRGRQDDMPLGCLVAMPLVLCAVPGVMMPQLIDMWLTIGGIMAALIAIPGIPISLWWECHRPDPFTWQLDHEGLHECWRFGRRRTYAWSSLRGVTENDDAIVVEASDGEVTIPTTARHAGLLLRRLREVFAPPSSAEPIGPEQIAEWLGIGLDDSLRGEKGTAIGWVLTFFLFVLVLLQVMTNPYGALLALLPTVVMLVPTWRRARSPLAVTPYGFYRFGRLVAAWDEIKQPLEGFDNQIILRGTSVELSDDQRSGVANAVAHILAAREEGVVLARMTDVPETALSRASDETVNAELGLSRTTDPGSDTDA